MFQHTAARRRLPVAAYGWVRRAIVSTHSRPTMEPTRPISFNTQPPEGGCQGCDVLGWFLSGFNTQPPEGGCEQYCRYNQPNAVSTHSRPKAAARVLESVGLRLDVSTHSRPKAAAPGDGGGSDGGDGFNTQPPEGGCQ